jgi:hypothetical protein
MWATRNPTGMGRPRKWAQAAFSLIPLPFLFIFLIFSSFPNSNLNPSLNLNLWRIYPQMILRHKQYFFGYIFIYYYIFISFLFFFFPPFSQFLFLNSKFQFRVAPKCQIFVIFLFGLLLLLLNTQTKHQYDACFVCVLVRDYSLLNGLSHMSHKVGGQSHNEINSYISLIIWVLHFITTPDHRVRDDYGYFRTWSWLELRPEVTKDISETPWSDPVGDHN